jgi:integrase/recombinase XerD
MKNDYKWISDMARLLQLYLTEKKMTGFKFEKQGRELERFDSYYHRNGYTGIRLTKSMVDGFIYGIDYEKPSTHYKKEVLLNSLATFIMLQGHSVYIPLIKLAQQKRCSHVPYIFSKEELKRFFLAMDQYPQTTRTNRNTIDPVLFRLLYGSGLRVSEALNLRCKDIDFETGTITILHAKNDKDRLVPIAASLTERFRKLFSELHTFSDKSTHFFISTTGGRIDKSTVYCRFRDYLLMADISHTQRGPRVHDLRYPNLYKIQTFLNNYLSLLDWDLKRFGFYFHFLLLKSPQKFTNEPSAFFHFGVTFLSFSLSRVASAFAESSVVMSRYSIVVWSCSCPSKNEI